MHEKKQEWQNDSVQVHCYDVYRSAFLCMIFFNSLGFADFTFCFYYFFFLSCRLHKRGSQSVPIIDECNTEVFFGGCA